MAVVRSDLFSYDRKTQTMSAEASSLGKDLWEQVYPDAADAGFRVASMRTGKVVKFVVHEEKRAGEDIVGWVLKAVRDRQSREPIFDTLTIVVYND
jgi:hypothetical protein